MSAASSAAPFSFAGSCATDASGSRTLLDTAMLQPSTATAIMQAFSNSAGRMASEPVDFSAGAAEPQDGAEVIPIVSPTVVAFIGRTERGPLNEPVAVKGFEDFSRIFGGHISFSF